MDTTCAKVQKREEKAKKTLHHSTIARVFICFQPIGEHSFLMEAYFSFPQSKSSIISWCGGGSGG